MPKMTPIEAMQWAQVAMSLISIGATTYGAIRQSAIDSGWAVDDARLLALDAVYAERIAKARAEAGG